MTRFLATLVGVLVVSVGAGRALTEPGGAGTGAATTAEAASVARGFFTSLNGRRYERTCALLAEGYLRAHRLGSRGECSLGLRVGFMWSQEIRFRIGDVHLRGARVVVEAVADGARGELELAREGDRLKVLAVRGG